MVAKIDDGLTNTQRYIRRKIENSEIVPCACGCGTLIRNVNNQGRPKRFVTGHGIENPEKNAQQRMAQRRYNERRPAGSGREERKARYKTLKLRAMYLLGNCCFSCGVKYNGSNAAIFDFHHVDPSLKDDQISSMLINKSWKKVLKELTKCELFCKNCHALHHSGGW